MNTSLMILIVLGLLASGAGLFVAGIYNTLVGLRNRFTSAYAQIDVQLKRRYDLIPHLVETAQGYLEHERGTCEAVIAARNAAASANTGAGAHPGEPAAMNRLASAEGTLADTLSRLFALSEAYPELRANTTLLRLMWELTSTENKVSLSRQSYNDSVMAYNRQREMFPYNIIAGTLPFSPAELFFIEAPEQREATQVSIALPGCPRPPFVGDSRQARVG